MAKKTKMKQASFWATPADLKKRNQLARRMKCSRSEVMRRALEALTLIA